MYLNKYLVAYIKTHKEIPINIFYVWYLNIFYRCLLWGFYMGLKNIHTI